MWLPAEVYDHEQSVYWAGRIVAMPTICWVNALDVLREDHRIGVYVEGFALDAEDWIYRTHGWVETPAGRVIDPTFPTLRICNPATPYRYLPALRFTWGQVYRFRYERFPRYNDGNRNFRLEKQEPWVSVATFVYRHRHQYAATGPVVSTLTAHLEGESA